MEENFKIFLSGFESKFIEFFSSQCSNYDYALNAQETKKVAKNILDNLFADKIDISSTVNATIVQMKKDDVFIGFLINKVFYILLKTISIFFRKRILIILDILKN
ncbi:MAG: hypothetical protein QM482_08675 [Sulfurospirillum sp.]